MWGSTRLVTHQNNTLVSRHADLATDLVNPAPTFVYDDTTGRLTSVTKPETGTTAYAYNTDGTVLHTIDAKNQKTEFTYDALKRVTAIKRFVNSSGVWVEQPCQEVSYTYDANPDTGATYNLRGRLARVVAKQCDSVITSYSEYFEYETSGLLQHRDSVWKRYNYAAYTLTRRVDPTFNQLGLLTSFGYGATGSLYSYAYTYDNAWRPATMTGESLTLVNGVTYNAAGAMTAFTRNDGSGTNVTNSYTFNHLFQLTNQTVTKGGTTLQNLTYNFSTTQNNGQILSQIDAVSGETVEYAYDSLNRLLTAATTGPQWGLSFTYDGFGNRTNQSVTKGSGPTHSVAIDPATNRISTSGYTYDNNGNMTQMPQLTMSYDVANRMTTANHASGGTQVYGYNHANQRAQTSRCGSVRNGNTVTYYLYGLGGERLMEFEETCTSGACTSYTETQRWIYFAGRKMFSKTGTTLKAITPNRLASEAKHFPYGETDGTPPSDTKDYFATYRRDGTGLDYAWNRYYSPTMGRFTTADPYGGSQKADDPESWNRYGYVKGNPVNGVDPQGLECQGLYADPCFDTTGTARMPGGPVGSPTPGGWFGGAREPNGPPLEQPPEGVGVIVSHGSPQFTDCEDMAKKVPRGFFGRIVSTIQEHIYNNVRAIVDPTKAQQEISWAASTTSDFFTGNGASHRYYSRSDTPIEALMTSRWVGDAVYHFLEKNSDKARNEWQSREGFQMPFDPWEGPYAAGLNPVQQFLGSATIDIHPGENSISIVVYNNTSFPSLSYHLPVPDWERPGPMGNLRQYYHLVVPCN